MAEDIGNVEIDLIPDVNAASWKKQIETSLKKIGTISIQVEPDVSRAAMTAFKKSLQTKLDAMNLTVYVTPKIRKSDLRKSVTELNAAYKEKKNQPTVWLNPDFRITDVKKSIAKLNAALKASGRPTIFIDVETSKSIALAQAKLDAFNTRTAVQAAAVQQRIEAQRARSEAKMAASSIAQERIVQRERERTAKQLSGVFDTSSVTRYETAVMRSIRTLTAGWAVYATAVTAATTAAAAIAVTQFAKVEDAANQAAAVVAGQQFSEAIDKGAKSTDAAAASMSTLATVRADFIKQARITAINTAFNTEDAAKGLISLTQAGLNADQALKALDITARFSQAGMIDLERGTELLVQAQTALNLASPDAEKNMRNMARVSDVLTKAQVASVGSLEEITDALNNRAAASFTQYGQEIETVIATISQFTQAGLNTRSAGEQAAIALREVMRSGLIRAPEEFKKLGIEMKNANGEVTEFTEILGDLSKVYFSLTEAERVGFFMNLKIPERSSAALRQLLQAEQSRSLADTAASFKQSQGLTNQLAELQMQSLTQRFQQFAESVQSLFAIAGGAAAKNLGDFFASVAKDVSSGTDSGLVQLATALGAQLNAALTSVLGGLQSPDFLPFLQNVTASMTMVTKAFAQFFVEFARGATGGEDSSKGFLASIGELSLALGRFTAENLPKLGAALGSVVKFIADNQKVIGQIAKSWLALGAALFVVRRVLAPLVVVFRAVRATLAFLAARGGLTAIIAQFGGLAGILRAVAAVVSKFITPLILAAGAIKGIFDEMRRGDERGNGFVRFFRTLGVLISPIIDLLSWLTKIIFKLGEMIGKVIGKGLNKLLNDIADGFQKLIDFNIAALRLLGKAPGMGWADDLADKLGKASKGFDDVGKAAKKSSDDVEKSSKKSVKALETYNIFLDNTRLAAARAALATAKATGGDVEQAQKDLRAALEGVNKSEREAFVGREQRLQTTIQRYGELSREVRTLEKSPGIINEAELAAAREAQVEVGKLLKRRLQAQAQTIQTMAQIGSISREEAERQLGVIDQTLKNLGGAKIVTTVDQPALDIVNQKISAVAQNREAKISVTAQVDAEAKKTFDRIIGVFGGGAPGAGTAVGKNLDKLIAEARKETGRLEGMLSGLSTALKRPAVQAINGLKSLMLDLPRQLRLTFNTISPQLITIGQGVGRTLASGMSSMMLTVSAAGTALGNAAMAGLAAGLSSGFNLIVKPLLKKFTEEIPKLKGPIAYDAQLLQPAGSAIMGGFARGLESGFDNVRGWLRNVAPQIEESVPDNLMVQRTGQFLVDWLKSGKTLDPAEAFKDLVPQQPEFGDIGMGDSELSFLHKTASLKDTGTMAAMLAKLFGLSVTSLYRPGAITSSGNPSDHGKGWAADISGSVGATDRMVAALKGLYPSIIKQLIWHNKDVNRGFYVPDHEDHAHVAFQPAGNFGLLSGRIGQSILQPGKAGGVMGAIAAAAQAVGVPVALIKAIAKQESGFNPRAGSPAGAQGLMQLMPATARSLGVKNIYDPYQNALGGAKYIKQMLDMFKRIDWALAGYNAGPNAVKRFHGIPPYRETREYVRKVLGYFMGYGGSTSMGFGGFRALGGMTQSNQAYVVGERGRELFVPGQRGNVVTNANLERLIKLMEDEEKRGGKRGVTYQNQMTVNSNAVDPMTVASLIDSHNRYSMGKVLGG